MNDERRSVTVIDIVREYLKANGYDGLWIEDECGCEIEDLAPCGEMRLGCQAGYKVKCVPGQCPADGDCEWHIGPRRNDA
jgi:hypothetical protein